jgi:pimeloyl-ACP methyl ester carboxylesterase
MVTQTNYADLRLEKISDGGSTQIVYFPSIMGETRGVEFVEALASRLKNSTVSVLEYPGCGASTSSSNIWKTVHDAVYDLGRMLDMLSDRSVILIGASIGGWLAAEVAAWYPRKVRGLVLANGFGLRVSDVPAWSPFFEKGSTELDSAFYARANPNRLDLAKTLDPSLKDEEREGPYGLFLHLLRVQTLASRIGFNPVMHDTDLNARLKNILCPTLILWGQADGVLPPEYGQAFADQIPGAERVGDLGSGHFPLLEKPQEHARTVADFLSRLEA